MNIFQLSNESDQIDIGLVRKKGIKNIGSAVREKEHVVYARILDFSQLKNADSAEIQEQYSIFIPRTEKNAGSGSVRIRKVIKSNGHVRYEMTTKAKAKEGHVEVTIPTSEANFLQMKVLAEDCLYKHRYIFKIKGTSSKWEVDVVPDGNGGYYPWARAEIEVKNLDDELPEFPIKTEEIILPREFTDMTDEEYDKKTSYLFNRFFARGNPHLEEDNPNKIETTNLKINRYGKNEKNNFNSDDDNNEDVNNVDDDEDDDEKSLNEDGEEDDSGESDYVKKGKEYIKDKSKDSSLSIDNITDKKEESKVVEKRAEQIKESKEEEEEGDQYEEDSELSEDEDGNDSGENSEEDREANSDKDNKHDDSENNNESKNNTSENEEKTDSSDEVKDTTSSKPEWDDKEELGNENLNSSNLREISDYIDIVNNKKIFIDNLGFNTKNYLDSFISEHSSYNDSEDRSWVNELLNSNSLGKKTTLSNLVSKRINNVEKVIRSFHNKGFINKDNISKSKIYKDGDSYIIRIAERTFFCYDIFKKQDYIKEYIDKYSRLMIIGSSLFKEHNKLYNEFNNELFYTIDYLSEKGINWEEKDKILDILASISSVDMSKYMGAAVVLNENNFPLNEKEEEFRLNRTKSYLSEYNSIESRIYNNIIYGLSIPGYYEYRESSIFFDIAKYISLKFKCHIKDAIVFTDELFESSKFIKIMLIINDFSIINAIYMISSISNVLLITEPGFKSKIPNNLLSVSSIDNSSVS